MKVKSIFKFYYKKIVHTFFHYSNKSWSIQNTFAYVDSLCVLKMPSGFIQINLSYFLQSNKINPLIKIFDNFLKWKRVSIFLIKKLWINAKYNSL